MNQILEKLAAAGLDLQEVTEEVKDGHMFMSVRVKGDMPYKSVNISIRGDASLVEMLQLDQAIGISPDAGFSDQPEFIPTAPGLKLVEDI